jgi:ABC-type lipoprotein export system ATPase subunit
MQKMGKEDIIVAKKLVKTYDTGKIKVEALKGIDLVIKKGDMVSVMGPSGCGKTTLLNCLSGLDDVTSGDIYIEGMHLNTLNDNKKTEHRALRMGFIFQFYNLLPVLTAVENVELPLLVAGIRPKEARKKALEALEWVGLTNWKEHMPAELSGGQRQRVTIARALVNEPAIVWADEPTGDLDRKTSNEVMAVLQKLNKEQGHTFVIVSHDPLIGDKARRKITMVDGEIESDTHGN